MTILNVGSPVWLRVYKDIWVPATVTAVSSASFDAEEDDGGIWERWMEDEGKEWRLRAAEDVEVIGDFNDGVAHVARSLATWTGTVEVDVLRHAIAALKKPQQSAAGDGAVAAPIEHERTDVIAQADAEVQSDGEEGARR